MSTAGDIITLALKDAQIIDENETPSAALMSDALTTLNQMLGMWQMNDLYIYATTELTFTPTGVESYTIGPTGADIAGTSPQRINYAFIEIDGVNYPMVTILPTREDFEEIGITSVGSTYPDVIFYNNTYPNGTLFIYPKPSAGTMHLGVDVQLPNYALAPDAFSLGIEYEMPVRFNLAKILVAMMGARLSQELNMLANTSLRALQRANVRIKELKVDNLGARTEKTDFYSGYVR